MFPSVPCQRCHSFFFHLYSPGVGEAVGQVPEIAHVVEEPDLVDLLHLLPHESKDPEDNDAFDGRWEGAAFLGVPVVHQVGQEVHVKSIAEKLELTGFLNLDLFLLNLSLFCFRQLSKQ